MVRTWLRSIALCALCCAVQFGFLCSVFWALSWFASPEVTAWLSLALFLFCIASFQESIRVGRPLGLFWVAALLERPVKLKRRG